MRWLVELAVGALALTGLWVTVDKSLHGLARAWGWLVRDRVTPLLEDDYDEGEPLEELPPEQSAEALGFLLGAAQLYEEEQRGEGPFVRGMWHDLERERRAPWWEAEHRAAYESLGFDYPSGLMARVRELAP